MKDTILDLLKDDNKALTSIEINDLLNFTSVEDFKDVEKTLKELINEGKLHETKKGKYMLIDNCSSLLTGTLHINKSGNGFVDTKLDEDTFVPKERLNGAIDGDFVEIDVARGEGSVIKIIKRNLDNLVGEIVLKHNELKFELDDKKKNINVEITKESLNGCVEGNKVVVNIIKELKENNYLGEITKIIGHKNDPGVDILTIAAKHEIELEFSEVANKQAEEMATSVSEVELKDRRDLRKEIIFTIDGDDTKDIDDAISIKKDGDNYILGVHIADVSNYVREDSPLFDNAYEKGTSSYLADTVLPMLPHKLSNGICSLNEGEDRLTISCEMVINEKGKIIDHDIFLSVINSKKKMTYKNVNKILMEDIVPEGYENFADKLYMMQQLAHILRKEKISRGYIDFEIDEAKIIQDDKGKAIDVVKRVQLEGEKLIEDFMIAANETVATHITNMDLPFIYRVHDKPRPEKIEDFKNLVKILGYSIDVNLNDISPRTMQQIIESLKDKKEFPILSEILLRSMKKAIYSPNNIGHFGLGSKIYTHFTSPIRRFPDLVVHTLLHKYIFDNKLDNETVKEYENKLVLYAERASERELAAVEAEREVDDMKMAEYMADHIGERYEGIISGITNFGMFIKLPNLVEGLVHISTLKGFYNYVPELLSLVSESNIKYTIGDKVNIVVADANKETHTIDFEIVGNNNGDKKQESVL